MSQSVTIPTLKQLCASQILASGSHSTFSDENQKFFEYEVLCRLWNNLKSCPQGVLGLQNEMSAIERKYQNGNGQFPADVKVSAFFSELTKQFSLKFAEAGLQLGNLTPIYCEYVQLQEILRKKWEDEALKLIWDEGILPQLIGPAPQLDQPDDIRNWLKEEANAPQLMGVAGLFFPRRGISALPQEIRYCTQLQELNFEGNQISCLPEGIFEGCTELWRVKLNHNKISSLPETLFKGCTKLRDVWLYYNEISSVPGTLFSGCAQLRRLLLRNNRMTSLPETLFANCSQLGELSLISNQITSLPGSLFASCTELQLLWLYNNKITRLPEDIFANCTSLSTVNIDENPLFCIIKEIITTRLFYSCRNQLVEKKHLCYRNAVFNNYNCLSKLSNFVKLLSFGTENSAKIKDAFAQLERRDQCLIIEMVNFVSGIISEDLQKTEHRLFEDMKLFCLAIRKGIYMKLRQMSDEERDKVAIEIYHLGKLEMMQSEEFMECNSISFATLLEPDLDPEWERYETSYLGSSYAPENVLLLIDAMDRVGV